MEEQTIKPVEKENKEPKKNVQDSMMEFYINTIQEMVSSSKQQAEANKVLATEMLALRQGLQAFTDSVKEKQCITNTAFTAFSNFMSDERKKATEFIDSLKTQKDNQIAKWFNLILYVLVVLAIGKEIAYPILQKAIELGVFK